MTEPRYRHYKGGTYRFMAEAQIEGRPDGDPDARVAVYRSEADGRVWVRPLADFFNRLDDGTKRFTLLEDDA